MSIGDPSKIHGGGLNKRVCHKDVKDGLTRSFVWTLLLTREGLTYQSAPLFAKHFNELHEVDSHDN